MWVCGRCGAQNQDDLGACFNCGAVWQGTAAASSPHGSAQYIPYPPAPYQPAAGYPAAPFQAYPAYPAYPVYPAVPTLAGFWMRYAAYLIDSTILQLVMMPLFIPFYIYYLTSHTSFSANGRIDLSYLWFYIPITILSYSLTWGYNIFMLKKYQATLGKKALGLVVVRADAQPLDTRTIVIRETIGKFLSALACSLGYIWAGFDERRQAWHDKMAGTLVYRIK